MAPPKRVQKRWIPAAIAGAVALGGAIWGSSAKKKAAKKQREFALEQQRLANEYNSPKAQLERFKEANLNPNLIYGHGASSAGTYEKASEEGVGGEFQQIDLSQVGGAIGQVHDLTLKKAGMDKLEAETRKINQETDIGYGRWLVEKKALAQRQNDKDAVLSYDRAIKNMEMNTQAEYRTSHEGSGGVGHFKGQQEILTKKAALRKINAEITDINNRNKAIKELNKLLDSLPPGQAGSKALQIGLNIIITKFSK